MRWMPRRKRIIGPRPTHDPIQSRGNKNSHCRRHNQFIDVIVLSASVYIISYFSLTRSLHWKLPPCHPKPFTVPNVGMKHFVVQYITSTLQHLTNCRYPVSQHCKKKNQSTFSSTEKQSRQTKITRGSCHKKTPKWSPAHDEHVDVRLIPSLFTCPQIKSKSQWTK